jgi:uncharacterized protein DUF6787
MRKNTGWLIKLKERWGLTSLWQVIIVLIVFSLTGFSALYAKTILYDLAGISDNTPPFIRYTYRIIATMLVYQVLLLGFGFLLGQGKFFWNFEKKMLMRIGLFKDKKKPPNS